MTRTSLDEVNGAGAYVIEGELPRTWDDATLLRRIGPSVENLSDAQLETARQISGTDPGELRRMYVDNQRPPVCLTTTSLACISMGAFRHSSIR